MVAPGADPAKIALRLERVSPMLTPEGNLKISTSVNEVIENASYVYQWINDEKYRWLVLYRLQNGVLTYKLLQTYNGSFPLIIDPTPVFSTYSGNPGLGHLNYTTTYDKSDNLYAGAFSRSIGWPTTAGAYQIVPSDATFTNAYDVGINKYNFNGTALLYSIYFGGDRADQVNAMITNEKEELIIVGRTRSTNLPSPFY